MLISSFFSFSSFDREALGKISEKQFVALLKSKDDIPDEDIQEMLEEYYRIAKLKGITTDKPDPPSDSSDDEDDDDEEGGANPPPPPPPTRPTVKSPPTTKRAGGPGKNSSIKSPTKSQTATIPEDEKWIDYRGTKKQKQKNTDTLGQNSTFYPKIISKHYKHLFRMLLTVISQDAKLLS